MGPLGTAGPFENMNDCSVLELAMQPYRRPNTDRLWVWRRHSQSALIIPLFANRLPDRLNGPVPHNGYSL